MRLCLGRLQGGALEHTASSSADRLNLGTVHTSQTPTELSAQRDPGTYEKGPLTDRRAGHDWQLHSHLADPPAVSAQPIPSVVI